MKFWMIIIAPMNKVEMKIKFFIVEDEDAMPTHYGIMSFGQVIKANGEISKPLCYPQIKGCF